MNTSKVLVILLVGVGIPAVVFSEGDYSGLSLDLGTDLGTDDSALEKFLNNAINGDDFQGNLDGNYRDRSDTPYDGDDFNFYPIPVVIDESNFGSRHVSSVADLINLVLGLGGHVIGRGGWVIRNGLGALLRLGALVNPTLDAGRDGLLYSKYKLGNDNYSLMHRSKGYLRSHPAQPSSLFDTLRRRFSDSD